MLFNSNEFLLFFAVFLVGYVLAQSNLTYRNILIVVGSYVFYSGWDVRFTSLLFLTTILDFTTGWLIAVAPSKAQRKGLVCLSVVLNLGILCVFKYFNFFRDSFATSGSSLFSVEPLGSVEG